MFKFSQQIAAQLKSQIFNHPNSTPKNNSQFQLSQKDINKRNSRLIRRMSSSIMGLVELCKVNTYSPPQIITILQENHEHSKDDISKLQTFLSNSQIFSDLKESNFDIQIINKILITFISFLKIETFYPNDCLCYYGASPHKVFILLEGNIRIIKPISNEYYCNGFEYFGEIMKIKNASLNEHNIKLNTELLLEKTINANYHIYPLDKNELHLMKFIIFHEMYIKFIVKSFPYANNNNDDNNEEKELKILFDLLKQCYLSQKDFNIKYPHSISYLPYIKSAITSELNQRLNDEIIKKYSFIYNTTKSKVQIFSYSSTYLNIEGDFIGETSFGNGIIIFPKYTEYAICIEKSFCVSIPFDIYFQNIHNEREKIKTKEIGFLLQTHLLRPIHFRKFKRAYFSNFILKQYNKGEFIINDNIVKIGKVFIVKEGEIQISIKTSIVKLLKIHKRMNEILKENDCKFENKVTYNEKEILNKNDYYKVYTYKLICLGEKDVFGNGFVYYDVDNFCNVNVVSDKAKVYEVTKDNFLKMAENDVDVRKRFKLFGIKKIKNLLDRINNILNYALHHGNAFENEIQNQHNENENETNNENILITKYSFNNIKGYGNINMKPPYISLTSHQVNKKLLCCNSPIRIGKSTTMKEYLSFTKKYNSSRNDNNIQNISNNEHHHPLLSTFTIESTTRKKQLKPIKVRKSIQKKGNVNYSTFSMNHLNFEDRLLKYSKMLVQTASFINDNTVNRNYFGSPLMNVGRCFSQENQESKMKPNKSKINIKKNNLKLKTSPIKSLSKTLTSSHNEQCSTLETKLPNIPEMLSSSRHICSEKNIIKNNKKDDYCVMEINIQPKDFGMKGKKVNSKGKKIKMNNNILYKKVIGNKLGY